MSPRALKDCAASVNVVGKRDMELLSSGNALDILAHVPGIFVTRTGDFGRADVDIRGLGQNCRRVAVLVDGKPETLTLKRMLECYRDYRVDVIRRRTRFLLDKAEARAHIVEGLLKALDIIDEVIQTIRQSPNPEVAEARLVEKFEFSNLQAQAILRMTLARLTNLERQKLVDELEDLRARIVEYKEILGSEQRVLDVIVERNAFGRQNESFESDLEVDGLDSPMHAVFIRAPLIDEAGEGVDILAEHEGRPVVVREDNVLASSFHPELTDDLRLHQMLLDMVA